jgi:hypothetical protein
MITSKPILEREREREREPPKPPTPTTLQNPPEANPFLSPHEKNQNQEHPKRNLKPGDSKNER